MSWSPAVAALAAVVAVVVVVAAVVAVGAAVIEEEVAAGSLLDHRDVLELLSQLVDPEGETHQGRVLVRIMMCLDVKVLANTFKLSEGAPEQLNGELIVIEERFLVGVLGRRLLPLLQLLPTVVFVVVVLPSSPLRRRWAPRRHLLLLLVTEDL
jgi:hypothetical protein